MSSTEEIRKWHAQGLSPEYISKEMKIPLDEVLGVIGYVEVVPYPFPPLESVEYFDLRHFIEEMKTAASKKDLTAMINWGSEALVYTGTFYEKHNFPGHEGIYDNILLALKSASNEHWINAEKFTRKCLEHLGELFKDVQV